MAAHQSRHGDGVKDVAFLVEDIHAIMQASLLSFAWLICSRSRIMIRFTTWMLLNVSARKGAWSVRCQWTSGGERRVRIGRDGSRSNLRWHHSHFHRQVELQGMVYARIHKSRQQRPAPQIAVSEIPTSAESFMLRQYCTSSSFTRLHEGHL